MIVLEVDIDGIFAIEGKSKPKVAGHGDRPTPFPLASERMQSPTRNVHVFRADGSIQTVQHSSDPGAMLTRNSERRAFGEESSEAFVAKVADHIRSKANSKVLRYNVSSNALHGFTCIASKVRPITRRTSWLQFPYAASDFLPTRHHWTTDAPNPVVPAKAGTQRRSYNRRGHRKQGTEKPHARRHRLTSSATHWTRAVDLARLQPSRPIAVKLHGKHIALFLHQGEVLACNNRCPHEGYPLVEGALDADCVLTCHWHNWKFDLKTGATIYGGDNLRVYPVKVEDGAVWLDTRDPPAAERIERALEHLDQAMAEYDTARIARELARLGKAGAGPELALARAMQGTYARLRDGMTHAYAAADAWLALRDTLAGETERLACATEALGYIAYDTLREPAYPFTAERAPWNAEAFAAAVESQDEDGAAALLNGALAQGLHFVDLEPALAAAALAHYNDFGHTLIYLMHVRRLIERLGTEVEKPLLLAWLRSLILATREDLLPDFRHYADALAAWPVGARPARN